MLCDNCIHKDVCSLEWNGEESLTFCDDLLELVTCENCKHRVTAAGVNICVKRSTVTHTEYISLSDFCSKGEN